MQEKSLELCFVQFHDIIIENYATVDQIVFTIHYIRLQWRQATAKKGKCQLESYRA